MSLARLKEDKSISPLEWLEKEFSRCWHWLEAALAQQPLKTHERDHVWEAISSGAAQFWPTPNSACVSEVKVFPTGLKSLNIWLCGGEMSEALETHKAILDYARSIGCDATTIHGRRGWLRSLDGYVDCGSSMMKDIRK